VFEIIAVLELFKNSWEWGSSASGLSSISLWDWVVSLSCKISDFFDLEFGVIIFV